MIKSVCFRACAACLWLAVAAPAQAFSDSEVASAFAKFDLDADGQLTFAEFQEGTLSYGEDAENLAIAFRAFDADGDSVLTLSEFSELIRVGEGGSEEGSIKATFQFMDFNRDGFVEPEELKRAMEETGQRVSDADIAEGMSQADRDGDGRLSLEEFAAIS